MHPYNRTRWLLRLPLWLIVLGFSGLAQEADSPRRTVRAKVQPRPGAEVVEIDMEVARVPVDPPLVSAAEAGLADDALVLGIEGDGLAVAFPIRTLANFEVLNSSLGSLPVAPTW